MKANVAKNIQILTEVSIKMDIPTIMSLSQFYNFSATQTKTSESELQSTSSQEEVKLTRSFRASLSQYTESLWWRLKLSRSQCEMCYTVKNIPNPASCCQPPPF